MATRKAFPLRLDPKVYEALRRWADDEMRSVNAQIGFILTRALRESGRLGRQVGAEVEDEDGGSR